MSQYSNGWWWCETRQSRLLLIGTARVSFIHSFIHLFIHSFVSSHLGSGKSTTGIHLSFFFSFLYILFDSLCANAKEEWGKNNSLTLFSFFILYNKNCWSSKLNYFHYHHRSIGQHHSMKEKEEKRQVLITNHPSHYIHFPLPVPNVNVFYIYIHIWSCMPTFPLWIEKKRKRMPEREYH